MENTLKNIILMGENVNAEFKEAKTSIPKNLFETVCAFLNTTGGYIILGVNDERKIVGLDKTIITKLKKDYVTLCNNKEILNPTIISKLNEIKIDGKTLLYTYIEESDEIHNHKNKVYIRNYEGDFDISKNYSLIASVHNHKRKIYDEDIVFPYISLDELNHDLIDKARNLANNNMPNKKRHIWMDMTDLELLKSAGLYKKDTFTGKYGITLAGIMLFGDDTTILNCNPYCRTDALLRVDDLDRYDDRDDIRTNLIDTYDRLLDFICKHTKDRFTLDDNMQRVSSRNIMAREMVINTLMHRDILDGHTSRLIIYEDKMVCENPNCFKTNDFLSIKNYTPFAKNPTLAKFFKEIGYADELGSGVRRLTKYSVLYSGKLPIFEDKEMFRLTIPLSREKDLDEVYLINLASDSINGNYDKVYDIINKEHEQANILKFGGINDPINDPINEPINDPINSNEKIVLLIIATYPKVTREELSNMLNKSEATIKRILAVLKEKGYIERIGSKKNGYWKILK